MSIVHHFTSHSLKEHQKVLPSLSLIHLNPIHGPTLTRRLQLSLSQRMTVDVLDKNGWREGWTVVDARAAVGVATGSYFEVEGTVYLLDSSVLVN
jgi:hypothetical protein